MGDGGTRFIGDGGTVLIEVDYGG